MKRTLQIDLTGLPKAAIMILIMLLLTTTGLYAQTSQPVSGTWDAAWSTSGSTGYTNWGSGVIQFLSNSATGCQGSAVHETSAKYDPTGATPFNQCFQVFFGCPGADNIGSDTKGDGMAFSFSKCGFNIGTCGGGLGYNGGCPQMITIEFDTYSSAGNSGFDATYGGGTTGDHDEVALHKDGNASDVGRITSADAMNLEDGLEHTVCINYNPTTHVFLVTIDGVTRLNTTFDMGAYFGAGGLNQTWSSGKDGAYNPTTVSTGTDISTQLGGTSLCPTSVTVTSPTSFSSCGTVGLTATVSPPTGNTVNYVEFFVDGVSVGTDNSLPYGVTWGSSTLGSHTVTAQAFYVPSGTNAISPPQSIVVGGPSLDFTSTAPAIDGTVEALWSSYPPVTLTKSNGATGTDLSATYQIMYDAANLYVLVNVTDDIPNTSGGLNWEKDGVEIYIDIGNGKTGCCGLTGNDYQYTYVYGAGSFVSNPGPTASLQVAKQNKTGPTGYIVEMKFPWSTLGGTPTAGTYIGFDVSVNDDDNGGTRDNQLSWNDGTYGEWQDASKFGTLQFSNCNPLPVSLLSFSGALQNGTAVLNWITAGEINNKGFIIERSANGTDWSAIGEVAGAGNSPVAIQYTYTDNSFPGGLVYYRLKQIDFDGASAYSSIVAVEQEQSVSVSPNPFDEVLTIKSGIKGDLDISIYDVLGRIVYHTSKKTEEGILLIQPDLSSGAYLITIQTDAFIEQQKIIKK